jgi:hypothetical protein
LSGKSPGLAGSVWDNRIGSAGCAATAMIKMILPIGEHAGQMGFWIGLATTGYLDYYAANMHALMEACERAVRMHVQGVRRPSIAASAAR